MIQPGWGNEGNSPPPDFKGTFWIDWEGIFTRKSAEDNWTWTDGDGNQTVLLDEVVIIGKSNNSSNILNNADNIVDGADILNLPTESIPGTVALGTSKRPISPRYYGNNWGGNQYTNTYKISKIGKTAGAGLAVASTFIDAAGVYNYYYNKESSFKVTPRKAGLNLTMGAYGMWINPIGAALYTGIDNFYPGGWPGAANTVQRNTDANRKIVPDYHPFLPKM